MNTEHPACGCATLEEKEEIFMFESEKDGSMTPNEKIKLNSDLFLLPVSDNLPVSWAEKRVMSSSTLALEFQGICWELVL